MDDSILIFGTKIGYSFYNNRYINVFKKSEKQISLPVNLHYVVYNAVSKKWRLLVKS